MRKVVMLAACLLAIGCVNAKVQRVDEVARPARVPDSVALLSATPDRPYTVIAVVNASSNTAFDSFGDLRSRVLAEAARLGADAVILGSETRTSTPIFNTVGFVMSERKALQAKAIVFDPQTG